MTDQEMRDKFHKAVDATLSGLDGDPLLAQRVLHQAQQKEEPKVKRKISVGFVIALVLGLMSVTALAAGLSLNLVEYFGKWDEVWANMADKTIIETQPSMIVPHELLGDAQVTLTNAYYDDEIIMVAYSAESGHLLKFWEPSEADIAALAPEAEPDEMVCEPYGPEQWPFMQQVREMAADGQSFGYLKRIIFCHHDFTANGIDINEVMGEEEALEDGTFYELMQFEELPEEVMSQDTLELNMSFYQLVSFHWFDGTRWYGREEYLPDVGTLTTTVTRTTSAQTTP